MTEPQYGMTPFQQVGFAVCIVLTVSCLVAVLWLSFVMAELRQMVETHEDRLTPSFVEEHKTLAPVPEKDPIDAPKTEPDLKQAHLVPPPDTQAKEFIGHDGTAHVFQFRGED